MGFVAQRIAGGGFGQLGDGADVAGMDDLDRDGFLAARDRQAAEAFLGALGLVPDTRVGIDHAGIDPEESLSSNEGIGRGLPDVSGQRAAVDRFEFFIARLALGDHDRGCQRGGHQADDRIQHRPDADLGRSGRDQYRYESILLNAGSQAFEGFLMAQFALVEIFFHQGVVTFGGDLHQVLVGDRSRGQPGLGDTSQEVRKPAPGPAGAGSGGAGSAGAGGAGSAGSGGAGSESHHPHARGGTGWTRLGADPQLGLASGGGRPGRARTITTAAGRAEALERLSDRSPAEAGEALRSLPGIGVWTAAEVGVRAWGDRDAVSFGDFHLARAIVHALTGRTDGNDEQMAELLTPWAGQRARAVRLLQLHSGHSAPRRGPRATITDHRGWSPGRADRPRRGSSGFATTTAPRNGPTHR